MTRSPLSHGQRALWFLDRLAPGNAAYVVAGAVRVRAGLDPEALRRCLRALTARHAALRTVFREEDGGPVGLVRAALEPDFTVVPAAESAGWDGEELARRLTDFAYRGFDLERGPLVRLGLFERDLSEGGPLMVLALHHIVSDFWSLGLLVRELGALYGEATGAGPADLAPLTLTYGDWVKAQEARLAGPEGERLWAYWRVALDGVPQVLELPADRPRPALQGYRGATVELRLPGEMSRRLARLGRDRGATVVMTLLAGFGALLGRWTGQERLLIGMPTTGRRSRELAGLVGYLVNPVAVGIDLRADPSFGELVERVRDAARGAFDHQDFPLPLLAERLQPERDPSRPPFFQVAAVLQKGRRSGEDGIAALWAGAAGAAVPFGALELESVALPDPGAQFDVTLALAEWRGELVGRLQYDRDLFDGATVRRLAVQLERLLAAALADSAAPVSGLPLLGAAESHQVRVEWNEAAWATAGAAGSGLLHARFLQQARRAPEAEALVAGERRVSYGELAARSLRLAARLRARGVGPDVRVGVLCDRGVELVVGLLAVLEAGGCYVPLDPAYPAERLRLMLADSGAGLVLTRAALRGLLDGYGGEVEELAEEPADEGTEDGSAAGLDSSIGASGVVDPDCLAYVIYTSGSTGRPKGVAIAHRAAAALVDWALGRFTPAELAGTLASTSVCFDLSVFELFVPLAAGGRVILADNALALPGLPAAAEVTLVNTVPSAMAELLRSGGLLAGVRTVNLAGEPLRQSLVAEIYRNGGRNGERAGGVERVWNLYGPTEDTTYSTAQRIDPADLADFSPAGEPAIGRPLPGGRAYVLDRRGRPVPPGVPGELVLGGAGLARGYLGRGDLTAERFVPAPWGGPGSRLYRTGDLVRQRPDGGLVYLGRIDHQVKVRGFRVELEEIEVALRSAAGVREAVVVVHGDGPAAALAAYAAGEGLAPDGLRSALAARLPAYMVPSWIAVLPALPRLPNGKVDRGALPRPLESGEAGEAPANPTEVALAAIWCELLGVRRVGRRDHFFRIGGHSLLAARLAYRVRQVFGVEMAPAWAFEAPTLAALARQVERARGGLGPPSPVPGGRSPLSYGQRALWFLDLLAPGNAAYVVAGAVRVRAKLDPAALRRALMALAARHAALRTTFREEGGGPVALVHDELEPDFTLVPAAESAGWDGEELARRLTDFAYRGFDLEHGPLVRLGLFEQPGTQGPLMVLALHHIVSDFWSLGLLVRELGALYGEAAGAGPADLAPLTLTYGDWVRAQEARLAGPEGERLWAYWREALDGVPQILELPADRPRPALQGYRGATVELRLDGEMSRRLARLGRDRRATLVMTLLAGFGALLGRWTGQERLLIGMPTTGRRSRELAGLVGYLVNPVAVGIDLRADPSFGELVERVRDSARGAFDHQDFPLPLLAERLQPERDPSRPAFFQVAAVLQKGRRSGEDGIAALWAGAAGAAVPFGALELESVALPDPGAQFDVTLALAEWRGELVGRLQYDRDLFDGATVRRLAVQLERLLAAAAALPGTAVSELPLLSPAERQQVLIEWSYSDTAEATEGATALEQFEAWARRLPQATAVAEGERVWSYGELDARAGLLAARLRGLGARTGDLIGICLERSPELVAAVLAIGKCGAAYLPLDPAHPRERLVWQLRDAGARLLVTDERHASLAQGVGAHAVASVGVELASTRAEASSAPTSSKLAPVVAAGEVRAVVVGEDDAAIAEEAEITVAGQQGAAAAGQDALAYVIYTSGSTGRPKGTLLGQRGLSGLVAWQRQRFGLTPAARTTLVAGVGFDASVWEMWLALTAGASLWIPPAAVIAAPAVLGPWLTERAITHCFLSTPLAEALIDEGLPEAHHLQVLFTGGDRLHRTAPEDGRFQLVNLYGPTECTSVTTSWEAAAGSAEPPPIGRPVARLRTLLLDRSWALVPPGVAGELYVGGTGLAWGYLGRPELTAERFLPDAFLSNNEPGGRLYRTGDLARFRADGVLEFLGRIDQQVKVRGHRIELGEIEAALAAHPALREAAVLVRGQGGDTRLIACVVPRPGEVVAPADLRVWLAERLPVASVPSGWVALDALPLTPNGKVDRRVLAGLAEGAESGAGGTWQAPATPTEEALAAIWRELLGVSRVGREDDFFHLGGHSLLAARLASRVREAFGVEMGAARAFEAPTLAALAYEVDKARGDLASAPPPLVPVDRSRPLPLSFAQERLWFLEQLEPGSALYNVPGGLRLRGALDVGAVASALQGIVARHEALRTSFRVGSEAGPVQVVAEAVELAVPVVDLSGLSGVEPREAALRALARAEAVRPFDLGRAPLLRVLVVRLGPADHCLLVTLHHLVSDGWSLGLLVRELAAWYRLGAPDLGPLPVQYADFAVWQRSWLEGSGELERQVAFWRGRLAGLPEALELPADLPRPAVQSSRGGQLPVRFGRALAEGVRELARRSEATPFMVLLAGFAALLSRLTGQLDLAVGAPVAGRTRGETEELIGLFVNTLVLRCGLAGDPSVSELVGRARRTVLEATAHQELPFEKLVEALAPERDRSRPPLVQVVLAYQESPLEGLTLGDLEIEPLAFETGTAKFDLALALEDRGGELAGYLEYSSDLFYRATAKRFLEQLERLLAAAVAEPGLRLSELALLGMGERQQVVREWNNTAAVVGSGNGEGFGEVGKASGWERGSLGAEISALPQFEEWVERTPEAPAVVAGLGANSDVGAELVSARVGGGVVWSYAELNARAERLADRLRGLGAGPGDVVAICLERSPELVAAVLGIGKCGAAYLPLDPAHPSERLAWQLQDAAVRLLVTDERHSGLAGAASTIRAETSSAPTPGEVRVVLVSKTETAVPRGGDGQGRDSSDLDALAYVIYTSGSTGRPKGTLLGQRGLANLVAWHRQSYGLTPAARTTLVAGVGFDASVWEMWPTLAAGASLWIPPAGTVADPTALGAWIAQHGITHSFLSTPLAEALLDEGLPEPHALRFLLTGGDRLHRSAPAETRFRLVNHYGPTESTVVTTSFEVPAGSPGAPPIGRPIANIQALLLDRSFAPVPPGVAGELYVGGTGLAWGYLGRADLTAERFLPDAFATPDSGLGSRLYQTGDVARFKPDGVLEFLGRADQQVKVRGHRIELGEIESVLAAHPAVRDAAVLVEGTGRDARLDAYLVPRAGEEVSPEALRDWLAGRLPAALIPTGWTVLEALPLNANGKVDRQALARLSVERADGLRDLTGGLEGGRQAPATPTEELLAAVWSDLLKIDRIGRDDNFFHLGGHSLLVARLATRIRDAFGVDLGVARTFEVPTLAAQAAEIEQALGAQRLSGPPLVPIARKAPDGSAAELPASFAQERLWFLDQLAPGNPAYNIAGGVRLTGDLDVAVLAAGLARIVERHEALRTTFGTVAGEGRPVQVIGPARAALPVIDLSGLRGDVRESEAGRLACAEAARPFDLACGPLLRCVLLRLVEEHRLLITLHHIVGDGWSVAVLVRELGELYRAGTVGKPARLPDLPVQYADFAAWQREWLAGDELARQTAYWRDRLAGAPAALDLPADRPRPPVQSHNGAHVPVVLPADLRNRLADLARRREATPFMVLLAAWNALLLRTTGQDDLVVGTPVAGRTRRETEDLIGFFVNTLPLRADLSGDPDFTATLARVRQGVLAAFAHQDLPFEKLVEALAPERDRSRSPIFQVMLAFQDSPFAALDLPGLTAEPFASPLAVAKFDLTLTLEESGGLLAGGLEYCRDLFDRATAERLVGRLRVLLESVASHPDRRLSELPDLPLAERQQLLEWNAAAIAYPDSDLLLHELIGRQAGRTPEAPALVFAGETLCYRDLWALAGRLAARLQGLGAGPEVRVGICTERSPEMVIGLLAILRTGAAYVPLDPSYPADRLAYMLGDSKVLLLLAQRPLAGVLPEHGAEVVWLEESGGQERDLPELSLYPDAFDFQPFESPGPDSLAYVIYTSGSTGQPKGAMNTHRAIVNRLLWMQAEYGLMATDRVLQKTPFSFDVSVWEFFWPLLTGACLVVARPGEHREPEALIRTIEEHDVTTLHFVPSMLQLFLETPGVERCTSMRLVIASGEALPYDLQQRFFVKLGHTGAGLHNLYGPTEAAVDVTYWPCDPAGRAGIVPIGRPVANTSIHLLDSNLVPVPLGAAGELYISGVQLARGYHGKAMLTAERFVPDPFSVADSFQVERRAFGARQSDRNGGLGARLYRTGDLARRLPSGEIEYLGRLDHQVKVRGFRIELGEIETALLEHPAVREAVVVARESRLVAYLVAPSYLERPDDAATDLTNVLARRLPEHMVPTAFVLLPALPLSPNGKVDRRALPEPSAAHRDGGSAPATATEELLAGIWRDLLGLDPARQVGREDHFFHLGGHSLLAARVVSRIREALAVEVPLARLFEAPTLAALAGAIDELRVDQGLAGVGLPEIQRLERPADGPAELPLSPSQERLWFLDQMEPGQALYNIPAAVRLRGGLDPTALAAALGALVERHETLRTRFASRRGTPVQVVDPPRPGQSVALPLVDLTSLPGAFSALGGGPHPLAPSPASGRGGTWPPASGDLLGLVVALAKAEAERAFDLASGPLLRATLLRTSSDGSEHVLLLTLHHIISDGWSMGILIRELAAFYGSFATGRPASLPLLPVQFGDFAAAQRSWLTGPELERQLVYWRTRLAGLPPVLELPADRPRLALPSFRGTHRPVRLGGGLAAALRVFSHARSATPFMTLLAAFQALLGRWTGLDDLAVGTPIAGRTRSEVEGLIGFFVNTLVLRLDLSEPPPADGAPAAFPGLSGLVSRARLAVLDAAAHQDVPFDRLVEELRPERDASSTPLIQVMLAFQNTPAADLRLPRLELERLPVYPDRAKLDLTLSLAEVAGPDGAPAGDLAGVLELSRDLFDVATMERLAGHLERLLAAALAEPERPWRELPLLTPPEAQQLLVEWSSLIRGGGSPDPVWQPVHRLFEEQAARTPHAVAVVGEPDAIGATGAIGANELTYRDLDAWAERIARRLRRRGVGPDVLVGVAVERSFAMVAGLLGILKAGGAYLPLDLGLPPERLRFLVEDSGLRIVLARAALIGTLGARPGTPAEPAGDFLSLLLTPEGGLELVPADLDAASGTEDPDGAEPAGESPATQADDVDPAQAAYVIYTSGSTGRPKGVPVPHAALGRRMLHAREVEIRPGDRFLHKTTLSFDASVGEVFSPLVSGATIVLARPDGERDTAYLIRLIQEQRVSHVSFTPSVLTVLLDEPGFAACRSLRTVLTGGETVPPDLPARFHDLLGADLFNRYGPTEATISVLSGRCDPERRERVPPIGRPIGGARIHLLDRALQPVPAGVPGELCVGGGCLARGYLGRPDLTAQSFVPDPFGADAGASETRLYRTGDLARFRADGAVEFLRRIDQQVKVRGFRIELGEVEAVLAEHPGVQDAVAAVHQEGDGPAGRRLVAFVVPAGRQDDGTGPGERHERHEGRDGAAALVPADLEAYLAGRVPAYMVPSAFLLLDELPLLPSGKADRRRLLELLAEAGPGHGSRAPYEAPSTPIEEMLAEIWGEVLGLPAAEISIHDRFFDLGGHSLQITKVLTRVEEVFAVEIPVRRFFEIPTLAALGAAVTEALTAQVDDERLAEILSEL